MTKLLVIGFGSIGARHARIAAELGHEVVVVSRRSLPERSARPSIVAAFASDAPFSAVVIATETGRHAADLLELLGLGYTGPILVEKPVFGDIDEASPEIGAASPGISVAYNLRHHPLLKRLRADLQGQRVLNAVVQVGQDLNQWRERDVAESYSSSRAMGGGVLRDLSHELDYLLWLFGPWKSVAASGGKRGALPGDADDHWGILLTFASGALVVLAMDYFCKAPVRRLTVNTDSRTYEVDLVQGAYADGGEPTVVSLERDHTYREQIGALLTGREALPTYEQGLDVLRLIRAVEQSRDTGRIVIS